MGAHMIETDKIINKGLLPVVRKRDIVRARTLSRDEKHQQETNGADIEIITPSGLKSYITRAELLKTYTYLDGKRISLAGWKSSKEYVVARLDNTQALAMMVPKNCTAEINGEYANIRQRSSGDYIVGTLTESGDLNPNTLGIMSAALFKKMYYMPPNEVITRHLGSNNREYIPRSLRQTEPKLNLNKEPQSPYAKNGEIDFGIDEMYEQPQAPVSTGGMRMAPQANTGGNVGGRQGQGQGATNYKYTAIGRLVSADGEVVGFMIQNEQGQSKSITKGQMMGLCSKKLVSNVMLGIKQDTGKPYLRGNNIRLEMLPEYLV